MVKVALPNWFDRKVLGWRRCVGQVPNTLANIQVPVPTCGKTTVAFFPDRVLMLAQGTVNTMKALEAASSCVLSTRSKTLAMHLRPTAMQRLRPVTDNLRTNGRGHIAVALARTQARRQRPESGYC